MTKCSYCYHSEIHYLLITAHDEVFYFSYTTVIWQGFLFLFKNFLPEEKKKEKRKRNFHLFCESRHPGSQEFAIFLLLFNLIYFFSFLLFSDAARAAPNFVILVRTTIKIFIHSFMFLWRVYAVFNYQKRVVCFLCVAELLWRAVKSLCSRESHTPPSSFPSPCSPAAQHRVPRLYTQNVQYFMQLWGSCTSVVASLPPNVHFMPVMRGTSSA